MKTFQVNTEDFPCWIQQRNLIEKFSLSPEDLVIAQSSAAYGIDIFRKSRPDR